MTVAVRRPPKTAAERQRLERERNKRAREAIIGLESFALNGVHWEESRLLEPHEILGTVLLVTRWAMNGESVVDEWRLTLSAPQRARTAKILEQANIFLPFCTTCGAVREEDETGTLQRCPCRQQAAASKGGAPAR